MNKYNSGIGTLNEHSLHAYLKEHYSPDTLNCEVKIGRYVADIVAGDAVFEVQTRNFHSLKKKLAYFLKEHEVTLIYPVAQIKRLIWVDPETGEITKPRLSPKTGGPWEIFYELIHIKELLNEPRLHLKIVLLELDEYRSLDGWSRDRKKGSTRMDRVPRKILREVDVNDLSQFKRLLPENLPCEFTSKDIMKCAKCSRTLAYRAINILLSIGIIEFLGKRGNTKIYKLLY